MARAAGRARVRPGEVLTCRVDLAMMDHYVPATDDESRKIVRLARDWSAQAGIAHFYDAQGICHVVLPERGHLRPGMFAVGGDSHSTTGGDPRGALA